MMKAARFWGSAVIPAVILLLVSFFCGGCVTLVEKTALALEGSLFAEKTGAVYRLLPDRGLTVREVRRKDGEALVIEVDEMPALRLYGSPPDADGVFYLTSYSFLVSNVTGWNEFSRGLSGQGLFRPSGDGAAFQLNRGVEVLDINEGRIRQANTRLSGSRALTLLRNRAERIDALIDWMRGQPQAAGEAETFPDQEGFEKRWLPVLFPELAAPAKRPPAWYAGEPDWARSEGVKWNRDYTRRVFSEELWAVRDSGALLRDWEEAAGWIYLQFEWDRIIDSLSAGIRLMRIQ